MEHVRQPLTEGQAIDLFVAYRFLRILTTPWEKQEAYKLGIIDKDGKLLRKAIHSRLRKRKNLSHYCIVLVFNLKRILHKIPAVRSKIRNICYSFIFIETTFC